MSTALTASTSGARSMTTAPYTAQQRPQISQTLHKKPQTPQKIVEPPPQAGTWKHPRFDEITRRQNATVFGSEHANRVAFNAALLVASFFAPAFVQG